MLMADDFFTVHEVLTHHGGLPDTLIIGMYAALAVIYFVAFRRHIWTTDYLLLVIALAFLGASIIMDALDLKDSELIFMLVGDRYHLVEDGPKLMGIAAWSGYSARVCRGEILSVREGASSHSPARTRIGSAYLRGSPSLFTRGTSWVIGPAV